MDEQRFDRIYREHAPAVYRFLAYRTRNETVAEDLLADVFERVFRAGRVEAWRIRDEHAWVFRIAVNVLRDRHRRMESERRALEQVKRDTPTATDTSREEVEDRDLVMHALERLSPEERDAVALRFGADLTAPQIAKATGESLTTVEGRIYRGLRKLRGELTRVPA